MSVRTFLLRFLIIYVVVVFLVQLIPTYLHRGDFDRAFNAWYHDRTAENEARLHAEQKKNQQIILEGNAVISFVLVAAGFGIYFVGRFAVGKLRNTKAT